MTQPATMQTYQVEGIGPPGGHGRIRCNATDVKATNEPEHRVNLLHRNIRKFGTITNTLADACELTGEMVARREHHIEEGSDSGGFFRNGNSDSSGCDIRGGWPEDDLDDEDQGDPEEHDQFG